MALSVVLFLCLAKICCCRVLPPETSIFSTHSYPSNRGLMATIGNGYVGLAALSDTMYISGVFNGPIAINSTNNGVSHRARIRSTNSFGFDFGSMEFISLFVLDVNNGYYQEQYTFPQFNVTMNHTIYAHQYYKNLLISMIEIDNTKGNKSFGFGYYNNNGKPSNDFNFTLINCPKSSFSNLTCSYGSTQIAEYTSPLIDVVLVHFNTDNHGNINVSSGTKQILYKPTVLLTTLEESASTIVNNAVKLFESFYNNRNNWLISHINAWESIWMNGRIDVIGNDTVAAAIYSSLYYIINSIRKDWAYGLSPGSLSSNAYNGHTFWDMESWMYPPLLMLQSNLGQSCLEYRTNRIYGAEINANISSQSNQINGSVRYPWESAFSGIELCPPQYPTGKYEIHINADIPMAMRQYFYMTKNITWLEINYNVLYGICKFWDDWSYYNDTTKLYEFLNVQGPDETYVPVNNSGYTNNGAAASLSFCIEASNLLNKNYPSKWNDIANNVYIPFDNTHQYHPESDNYKYGMKVGGADTILLYYPWQYNGTTKVIQSNDLNYYVSVTNAEVPGMVWSMYLINYLEMNEFTKAQSYFQGSYANIYGPFNVWTETPGGGGSVNFITGAGAFLQQFIFGYPQIRVNNMSLSLNFRYLPWPEMRLIGIEYLQNMLDFVFCQNDLSFNVTVTQTNGKISLKLIDVNGAFQLLLLNKTIIVSSAMNPIRIVQS